MSLKSHQLYYRLKEEKFLRDFHLELSMCKYFLNGITLKVYGAVNQIELDFLWYTYEIIYLSLTVIG